MTYEQAQINCQQKFGSYKYGRLVEPMSIEIGNALVAKAKVLNVIKSDSHAVWIGYDQIGRETGNFKYASTGLKSPLESVSQPVGIDGAGESCMTLESSSGGAQLDDKVCETPFASICEGF